MTFGRSRTALVLAALAALVGGVAGAATGPAVNVATVTEEISPWCVSTGFLYDLGMSPNGSKGLDVNITRTLLSPSEAVIAVNQGNLAIDDCTGVGTIVQAWNKGAKNIVIVAVDSVLPVYVMLASKKIARLQDLKGKAIGSNGPQTTATKAVEAMLREGANLLPERDYSFVQTGSTSARSAALLAGKVDAIPATPLNDYQLVDSGFNVLARERRYVPNNVEDVMLVNRQWAQANRATLVSLLKEMTLVSRWLKDPRQKNDVIAKMARFVTMGSKPIGTEYAHRVYGDIVATDGGIATDGYAAPQMFVTTMKLLAADGIITKDGYPPLDQIVDYSYLNAARHELGLPNVKPMTAK